MLHDMHERLPGSPPPIPQEQPNSLRLKEAEHIKTPEKLSAKQISKEKLSGERIELAREIRKERTENQSRLKELRARLGLLELQLRENAGNMSREKLQLENHSVMRAEQATTLAGRVRGLLDRIGVHQQTEIDTNLQQTETNIAALDEDRQLLQEERENVTVLLEDDAVIKDIKGKISAHYKVAGEIAESEYEGKLKSVPQVMIRNGVFVVHTINENPHLRHNENSNVSGADTTFEDDLMILLSLEPSISASTVKTGINNEGKISGLWSQSGGVLIGKGEIKEASSRDTHTQALGIKQRSTIGKMFGRLGGETAQDIDAVTKKQTGNLMINFEGVREADIGGYNELVIANPEVFGFFKPADMDQDGNFWIYNLGTKKHFEELHKLYGGREFIVDQAIRDQTSDDKYKYNRELGMFSDNLKRYRDKMNAAKSMGLPLFVMTPDRRVLECLEITDAGQVIVGKELKPEDVANGKAGIVPEDRKRIGEKLLAKKIFKYAGTATEARSIIESL